MADATQVFADHRELLFSIVYGILASVADTEDVLQETWLSWASRDHDTIENARAYLVRIAVNKALTQQSLLRRRRETYVGPWLPEPLVAADGAAVAVERAEAISMALLVVLESLTPTERAVFILYEVFGYGHPEIAAMLGRTHASVRQISRRARAHVQARRPLNEVDPQVRQKVTERFVAATFGGDLDGLLEMLAPEVTLWTDGGGKAPAAGTRPIHGRDKVARLLITRGANAAGHRLSIQYRYVNGDPSAVVFADDSPFGVMVIDLTHDGTRIGDIYVITNPDKLSHIP
ncbi:RNA polymerase sigma-70 factor (ECF subfamily) [Thermocatellispora tengchongensis]|uniref:RNA polymerase sigma-70 factor (ECF subfamily) n=1 Tax=Thermocatellispora tengchongensis TaxID=1073253 RepID=A0A840P4D5_9ACTN|nr:RNA polymerase sigma factor SigJ [Thermocatellispora tengchongensis]MBB5130905.1 RNA polymerase sigma-70 factor (ECF subfamily) [Thermocatellispora tengchongensis]